MNFASTNYYCRLGIARGASTDDIRKAFRNLARIYHPDVADNKSYAEEVFKRLNEAYETLADAVKRRLYDQELLRVTGSIPTYNPFANNATPPRPRPASPPPSPVNRNTRPFQSNPGHFQYAPPPRPKRAAYEADSSPQPQHRADLDIEAALEVTLEDAVQGATYVVTVQQNDLSSRQQNVHTCRVHVPALVYEGQRLRLKGLGYVDHQDFCIGDLYLTIKYGRHKRFRTVGAHLYTEISITPWEAALGARVRFDTLDGMADLHVPQGAQPGCRLRLARSGLPQKDGIRGDILVTLTLRIPTASSEKERQLWRALASQHGHRPI